MAKTNTAAFAQTCKTATAVCVAAATITTDSPANVVLLLTAGTEGGILTRLWAMPRTNVTVNSLVLYLSKDSGTTIRMIDSELMSNQTLSSTTPVSETVFGNYNESTPLRLEAGDRLYVGTQVAVSGGVIFRAEWTDF